MLLYIGTRQPYCMGAPVYDVGEGGKLCMCTGKKEGKKGKWEVMQAKTGK